MSGTADLGINYYAILDIPRDASLTDIQLAYRKWAIIAHPDRKKGNCFFNNPPEGVPSEIPLPGVSNECFWFFINEAFDVLSNPLYRHIYDTQGQGQGLKTGVKVPEGWVPPYCYHGNCKRTFEEVFGTYSPYANLIDAVTNPPPLYCLNGDIGVIKKDKDIERLLCLELSEILKGGIKKMKIVRQEFVDDQKLNTTLRERFLVIPIAPGILPGTKIRFKEQGDQGPTKVPADIIFTVADKQHNRFRRKGMDLYTTQKVTLKDALCGMTITVVTLDDRKLKIPIREVIYPGFKKCIEGEGLPSPFDKSTRGDLFVEFQINFPREIPSEIQSRLAETFDFMNDFDL